MLRFYGQTGYLGSHADEERGETRYVVRIAEFGESRGGEYNSGDRLGFKASIAVTRDSICWQVVADKVRLVRGAPRFAVCSG